MEEIFVSSLEAIPWFARVGEPLPSNTRVKRIFHWDDWPGPEDDSVAEIHYRHQALYDELSKNAQGLSFESLWKQVQKAVLRVAGQKVPYSDDTDAWHAPSLAVWQAAWTAGLVAMHQFLERDLPDDLREQWGWFQKGHWPCALEIRGDHEELVVY